MEKSQSPLPTKIEVKEVFEEILSDFPTAIKEIINGEKVTRKEWESKEYGFLNGEFLSLHKEDGKNYQWIVTQADLMAKDWIITKEK